MVPENLVTGLRTVLPILTTPAVSPETIGISVVTDRPSGLLSILAIDRAIFEFVVYIDFEKCAFSQICIGRQHAMLAHQTVSGSATRRRGRLPDGRPRVRRAVGGLKPGRNAAGNAARLAATHSGGSSATLRPSG